MSSDPSLNNPTNQPAQHTMKQDQETGADSRSEEEKEADKKLADRLSALIEDANGRVLPLCQMIRKVSQFMDISISSEA